jgi:hypothetical protein
MSTAIVPFEPQSTLALQDLLADSLVSFLENALHRANQIGATAPVAKAVAFH